MPGSGGLVAVALQFSAGFLPERKKPQQPGALGGTALEGQCCRIQTTCG